MLRRQVEIIAGARDVEVGIGVEALDKRNALMAQIILHLKIGVEAIGHSLAILQVAAEFAV